MTNAFKVVYLIAARLLKAEISVQERYTSMELYTHLYMQMEHCSI